MRVSIITVVYNGARTIRGAIESVLSQDYDNIEYIVIDGDSRDNTVDIVKEYVDDISIFVSEPDSGLYDAMNKGVAMATGDVVGFINADDVINSDDCIAEVVDAFVKNHADVVYGDKIYVDPDDTSKGVRYWRAGSFCKDNFVKGWMPPHLSTYIKRECYQEYGGYRDDFSIAADYELMLRFLYVNDLKVFYLPKVIAKMRSGGVSNSSLFNIVKSNIEVFKSWRVNGLRVNPLIVFIKPIKKIGQFFVKERG